MNKPTENAPVPVSISLALVLQCREADLDLWLDHSRPPCARVLIAVEKWCDEQERVQA